ncbi:hypothetical protein SO3561_10168 [Streptomyces olivochromogenes]|uniref:Uncharacterized protein n=1 Tax=Streptomyces olivochromogenes TaxID=1963 RepID=A0A286PGB5_STROL|nr:hypothetical protein SO3561_10168 [Streptomyces olivochromogenes]
MGCGDCCLQLCELFAVFAALRGELLGEPADQGTGRCFDVWVVNSTAARVVAPGPTEVFDLGACFSAFSTALSACLRRCWVALARASTLRLMMLPWCRRRRHRRERITLNTARTTGTEPVPCHPSLTSAAPIRNHGCHLTSLQLGGDPNDPRNLWIEPPDPGHKAGGGVNNAKDPVETKLHTAVCAGKVTLTAAQKAIVTDWTTALSSLGLG